MIIRVIIADNDCLYTPIFSPQFCFPSSTFT